MISCNEGNTVHSVSCTARIFLADLVQLDSRYGSSLVLTESTYSRSFGMTWFEWLSWYNLTSRHGGTFTATRDKVAHSICLDWSYSISVALLHSTYCTTWFEIQQFISKTELYTQWLIPYSLTPGTVARAALHETRAAHLVWLDSGCSGSFSTFWLQRQWSVWRS